MLDRESCPCDRWAPARLGLQIKNMAMTKMEASRKEASYLFLLPYFTLLNLQPEA